MHSRKIARFFRKHFGLDDIETALDELRQAAETGGEMPQSARQVLSNLSGFLSSIDLSYEEYDDRLKIATRTLDLSSAELTQANLQLERLNVSMRAILESLGEGLFFFDKNGICAPVYSKACVELLGHDPSGKSVSDVLRLQDGEKANIQSLIEIVFSPVGTALSFDELITLAPKKFSFHPNSHVSLQYRAMYGASGTIDGILVIATDITETIENQIQIKKTEEKALRTLRIARNKELYIRQLKSFETCFLNMHNCTSPEQLKREAHTLKGLARGFLLEDLVNTLHAVEDDIAITLREKDPDWLKKISMKHRDRLREHIDEMRNYGEEIWGQDFEQHGGTVHLETVRLQQFADTLKNYLASPTATPEEAVKLYLENLAATPIRKLLSEFDMQVNHFAEMSGREVEIHFEDPDGVCVLPYLYRDFTDTLVHVARNIVDHAYEDAQIREAYNKPAALQVYVRARYASPAKQAFILEVSDDGGGIAVEKLRKRLVAKGVESAHNESDDAIIQHIFDPDISTRHEVSTSSGRGIGLDAVKHEAQKLGGEAHGRSTRNVGTTLEFTLPVLWGIKA